jgi:hypothetical protein
MNRHIFKPFLLKSTLFNIIIIICTYFTYVKQAAKSNFTAVAFNEIRNHSIYNMYFLTPEEYLCEIETSLSLQFSSDIFTIIYKMNCFIYVAACKLNL